MARVSSDKTPPGVPILRRYVWLTDCASIEYGRTTRR
jgi:hypothetical protein